MTDQQLALGLRSIAVPLRQRGRVVAAASCSMPVHTGRTPWSDDEVLAGPHPAAARIGEELALGG